MGSSPPLPRLFGSAASVPRKGGLGREEEGDKNQRFVDQFQASDETGGSGRGSGEKGGRQNIRKLCRMGYVVMPRLFKLKSPICTQFFFDRELDTLVKFWTGKKG